MNLNPKYARYQHKLSINNLRKKIDKIYKRQEEKPYVPPNLDDAMDIAKSLREDEQADYLKVKNGEVANPYEDERSAYEWF